MSTQTQELDQKISAVLDEADRMFIATSVDGNSSGASVFFARDGHDLVFFTFHPTRKAEQIRVNPKVQVVIWPKGQEGIRGLQIEGECYQIKNEEEQARARELVLKTTTAFQKHMDDEFLKKNKVVGYYRIKPTIIKYVDFYAPVQFEWREYPENQVGVLRDFTRSVLKRLGLWIRAVRAPFFTAAIVPVLLGAVIAYGNLSSAGALESWNWSIFWLALLGGVLAHAGTNMANDYYDHTSRNDEYNKLFSPFNGGSRMIQAGLMAPWKVLFATLVCFATTIVIGLRLNTMITGAPFGNSPLLWAGIVGVALGLLYTMTPVRLGYRGLGEFSIALGFGPVMVLGTHYVLMAQYLNATGATWPWLMPLLASIPVAILIMLVVWINQFQDLPADKKVGKNTWVVRLADTSGEIIRYERPFRYYAWFNYFSFAFILALGIIGFLKPSFGTPFVLISLLPLLLVRHAVKWGKEWMSRWNQPEADRQKLPYELLKVNVSTIGVHFTTGLLLILGYWLNAKF
ncbi:MAG: UbiA family prenyltransferase [candidate division KSB1 bacterium]|nr:UbiA family prenyltransferase [candidate division KSB1 bacterium]MDZ7303889.1 UbiA family prenyltransferase [candidate division KSB1 bacterium]MDZ7313187.1 UbiA family prenyltransferase [candidate division KSB1 bacterium]